MVGDLKVVCGLDDVSVVEDGSNLSSVDPDVLARVANKLETVVMNYTHLTEQQMTRILTRSLLTTNLLKLCMQGNAGGGVKKKLQKQAEQVIKELLL